MHKYAFSNWIGWKDRTTLDNLSYPGVYAIAISCADLAGLPFSWRQVVYIGMTNAKGGLKSRLQQFDNTIMGREGHGGGCRVRFKHRDYSKLTKELYVSVCPQKCNVKSNTPSDLRLMGEVAKFEYECLAFFAEEFCRLPEFNDKQKSPKLRNPTK
ncbi:MAG: hypothetical protein HY665_07440 [Chloroflexi bacterium]|nr:hypothetical protein [Chloroflexota bacterium]